jgi:hypothetical protein
VEYAKKGIAMVDSGKTLAGVSTFDKNATLAWMTQLVAVVDHKNGNLAAALQGYEKSTAYAPGDVAIAGQNLRRVVAIRQNAYGEAVKAYNALPEADRGASEPNEAVKAAREKLNAEADAYIDAAAAFVAFARAKNLPAASVDPVNQTLETVYKSRFPEDATLDGLKKILAAKGLPSA